MQLPYISNIRGLFSVLFWCQLRINIKSTNFQFQIITFWRSKYSMAIIVDTLWCTWKLLTVDLKNSYTTPHPLPHAGVCKLYMLITFILVIIHNVYAYQIMLCTLNICKCICQLFFNKFGKKEKAHCQSKKE